jgi:phytoene dehydrogenase-like protein
MSAYFDQPRLKSAFTFQDVYMGLSPFDAPATFSMMPYTEMAHGVWYPKGGMYQIVEALVKIARQAGVEIVCDMTVRKIEVNGRRAKGLILEDGSPQAADAILANADLPYVYQELLDHDAKAESLAKTLFMLCDQLFLGWIDLMVTGPHPHLADDYKASRDQSHHLSS